MGYYIKTDDGEYAIVADNVIMFTDADYKFPSLTSVISVEATDKRTQYYVTRWIIDEINEHGSVEYAYDLVSGVYGQKIVHWYHQEDFYSDEWEDGQREGNDGSETDPESGSRGVRHRNQLPVGEDTSPRALLANAFEGVVDRYVQNYDSGLEARALNHIVENWDSIPKRIRDLKKQNGKKPKKMSKAVDTLANETLAAQPKGVEAEGAAAGGI